MVTIHVATINDIMQTVERMTEAGTKMEICHRLDPRDHFTENKQSGNCLVSLFPLKMI